MTIHEIIEAVDTLSEDDIYTLLEHIGQIHKGALKVALLRQAIDEIREGLTEEQLKEMEWAMNVEYIEPVDLAEWEA